MNDLFLQRQRCTEDTRISRLKQVIVFVAAVTGLFLLFFLPGAFAAPALSDTPGTASISIVPLDLKPRGVVLRGQTVDALIEEDGQGGVWATTSVWLKLHNAGKEQVVVPLALPGPQWGTFELPQGLEVSAGGTALPLVRAKQGGITLTTPMTLTSKGDVELRIKFRQALPRRGELVDYSYILSATRVWPGNPETLRVTARFATPLASDQVLTVLPPVSKTTADSATWQWTGARAPSNTALAFIAPSAWRELTTARNAAAAADAGLATHVALADRYWSLANLPEPVYEQKGAYYQRFWPMVVAELRAGVAAPGEATASEIASVRARLAELYRQQAERAPERAGAYLQLAATELREAAALDPGNAEIRDAAASLFERLASAAETRGDALTSRAHRAQVAALRGQQGVASSEVLSQAEAMTLAGKALDAGNLELARELAEQAYGPEVLRAPGANAPRIDQALATVVTTPRERSIGLQMVDRAQGVEATGLALAVARAWQGTAGVEASEGGLTVTVPYSGTRELNDAQARLLATLPPDPELALLRAALESGRVEWLTRDERFSRVDSYTERVDLGDAARAWEAEAIKLEAAAANPQRGEPTLDRVAAAAWAAEARRWRDLAARSRAIYRVTLQERGTGPYWLVEQVRQVYDEREVTREWTVPAIGARELSAEVVSWRYDRLGAVVVGLVAGVLLVALLLWKVLR